MVTKFDKDRISDFFDASELVDLLGITPESLVEIFEDELEDALDDLLEIMGVEGSDE